MAGAEEIGAGGDGRANGDAPAPARPPSSLPASAWAVLHEDGSFCCEGARSMISMTRSPKQAQQIVEAFDSGEYDWACPRRGHRVLEYIPKPKEHR